MEGLLVVERFVIESLNRGDKKIYELEVDTGLDTRIIMNILSNLSMKNIITYRTGYYALNMAMKNLWLPKINSKVNQGEEIKEIFITLINKFFKEENKSTSLKLKKVFLTKGDESILDMHFKKIEDFITSLKPQQKNEAICKQRVLFWGSGNYGELVASPAPAVPGALG